MNNFKNYLAQIEIEEKCFEYLKSELIAHYSFRLVEDLFSLPCLRYEPKHKLVMILSLLEDKEINDTIIHTLTQLLVNIHGQLWAEYESRITNIIESNYHIFSRRQLLLLANTIEIMYAKGYDTLKLANIVYEKIPLSDVEFNPDSDENTRIKLAKIAYKASIYNLNDCLYSIDELKHHLKITGRKHLLGMINYYKGICLKITNSVIGYNNATHYITKAKNRSFDLASTYFNYRGNNFETSNKC